MKRFLIIAAAVAVALCAALACSTGGSGETARGAGFPSKTPISSLYAPDGTAPFQALVLNDAGAFLPGLSVNGVSTVGGVDGGFTITTPVLGQHPSVSVGFVQEIESTTSDGGAVTALAFAKTPIPAGTGGEVVVTIAGKQVSDGGYQLGGDSRWICGVINNAGTCHVYRACAADKAWVGSDAGASAVTTTVAITSCVATATVTGIAGSPWHWTGVMTLDTAK